MLNTICVHDTHLLNLGLSAVHTSRLLSQMCLGFSFFFSPFAKLETWSFGNKPDPLKRKRRENLNARIKILVSVDNYNFPS